MLRLRNSNRRFSHKSNRTSGRYFSRRSHRASSGEVFVIENVEKMVQEDSYEEGAFGREMFLGIHGTYRGDTIRKAVNNLAESLGIRFKDIEDSLYIEEDGNCHFAIEENADGEQASSYELEQFKNGEINLYIADYYFDIKRLSPVVTGREIAKEFPKAETDF